MKALEVAKYLLFLARSLEAGDTISNLKMQKLLYYAQGEFLALFDKSLFDETIEAWRHGPVVPEVYQKFSQYERNSIDFKELDNFRSSEFCKEKEKSEHLVTIFRKYGSLGAWELVKKTHNESPWKDTYIETQNKPISNEILKNFFKEKLDKEIELMKDKLKEAKGLF